MEPDSKVKLAIAIVLLILVCGCVVIWNYQRGDDSAKEAAIIAELGFDPDEVLAYEVISVTNVTPIPRIYLNGQWVIILNQEPRRILQTSDMICVYADGTIHITPKLLSQSGINKKPLTVVLISGQNTVDKLVRQTASALIAAAKQKEKEKNDKPRLWGGGMD